MYVGVGGSVCEGMGGGSRGCMYVYVWGGREGSRGCMCMCVYGGTDVRGHVPSN